MKTKEALRLYYRQLRQQLSDEELHQRSLQLCRQFFSNIPLDHIHTLHSYLPMSSQREPDPQPILDILRREHPHIRLVVSRTLWQVREMEHVYWDEKLQLQQNKWGIPEPVGGEVCPVEKIDAVLVPLLAFDRYGHRLGYGAGFYDRFLSGCAPHALSIGLSLFPPLEEPMPGVFPTDVPLTHCLTPDQVYKFM
ncbi:5-formyltetrahydrofolate cyclo-ligase [Cesiribacter sp. SM1]|uniref:5-formyltetrahydrofolate cyclo-ligase n=1 Tax=Cesiribacter sp. SM1 TaxID=2861196 RepID=UPI001CD32B0B|nr:5-formyltetrahydrofolate cyclo-ligase [Cesiribacter sp. SM1]